MLIYLSKLCVRAGSGMGVLECELESQNAAASHIRLVLPRDGYKCFLGFMSVPPARITEHPLFSLRKINSVLNYKKCSQLGSERKDGS